MRAKNEGRETNNRITQLEVTDVDPNAAVPLILVTKLRGENIVEHACPLAHRLGIRRHMSLELASSIAPTAQITDFSLPDNLHYLMELAKWGIKYSPVAAADVTADTSAKHFSSLSFSPLSYGITLDLTGMDRIYQSNYLLAERLWTKLSESKITACFGFAPTIGAAWAISRFSRSLISSIDSCDKIPAALAPLPLRALRIDQDTIDSLKELGIITIKDILCLPQRGLGERFGQDVLKRLRQALGEITEELPRHAFRRTPELKRTFDPPLTHPRAVERIIIDLIKELAKLLQAEEESARRFLLTIRGTTTDNLSFTRTKEFSLVTATGRESHLSSLILPLLESLAFPGPITTITLTAHEREKLSKTQYNLFFPVEPKRKELETLNHLRVRLGKDRVTSIAFHASYLPERSFSFMPIDSAPKSLQLPNFLPSRPSRIFLQPEPAKAVALLPDKPPNRLEWRGELLNIIKAQGPERITPEWWQSQHRVIAQKAKITSGERDYFKVCDHYGRWLWIYRDNANQQWFVHGIWI